VNFPIDPHSRRQLERAERQVKNKISGFVWGLILTPIFFCLFAAVFGGIVWYVMEEKAEIEAGNAGGGAVAASTPGTWDGTSTFECAGNTSTTLSNGTFALTTSPAIRASSNCQLTLNNMNVTAPVVIEASGNARVTVLNGIIAGSEKSITASGNASVNVTGATVTGPTEASGLAEITGVP
jgi:hypothetical protein